MYRYVGVTSSLSYLYIFIFSFFKMQTIVLEYAIFCKLVNCCCFFQCFGFIHSFWMVRFCGVFYEWFIVSILFTVPVRIRIWRRALLVNHHGQCLMLCKRRIPKFRILQPSRFWGKQSITSSTISKVRFVLHLITGFIYN